MLLDQGKLHDYRERLDLKRVTREAGYLEYVLATSSDGIEIRYYEDGLYVLNLTAASIKGSQKILSDYFYHAFEPAINYLFSLGAPTPKILAEMKTVHPAVVSREVKKLTDFRVDKMVFGEIYSEVEVSKMAVFKTPGYILIAAMPQAGNALRELVEMQIFFREFKDHLERYLDIHRRLWEEITAIKSRRRLSGGEISQTREKLDSYQKTISLINNRINQMGAYIDTRASIARRLKIEEPLQVLFQYKFEVLKNTLNYIKELWRTTTEYLEGAIRVVVEAENQVMSANIKSLTIITAAGVVSGILGYLSRSELPKLTRPGVVFFGLLLGGTWLLNAGITRVYKARKYTLRFSDNRAKL